MKIRGRKKENEKNIFYSGSLRIRSVPAWIDRCCLWLMRVSPVSMGGWRNEEGLAEIVRYAWSCSARVRVVLGGHVGSMGMGSGRHHGGSHIGRVGRMCLRRAPGSVRRTGRGGGERQAIFWVPIIRGTTDSRNSGQIAGNWRKRIGMICLLRVLVEFEAGFGEVDVGYMEGGIGTCSD